jgi:hypothetical protein
MRTLFFIVVAIFLFFTAPVWVPIVGLLGLATMVGGGAAVVAANQTPAPAAAYVQPNPPQEAGCPCSDIHYVYGDPNQPTSWASVWADGSQHALSDRPPNRAENQLIDFAKKVRARSTRDLRFQRLAQNMLDNWNIDYRLGN